MVGDKPWIDCTPYVDEEHWNDNFNDQLYLKKPGSASWTHLQVKKADVLREFSRFLKSTSPVFSTNLGQIAEGVRSLNTIGKRRKLMEAWASYCEPKTTGNVQETTFNSQAPSLGNSQLVSSAPPARERPGAP